MSPQKKKKKKEKKNKERVWGQTSKEYVSQNDSDKINLSHLCIWLWKRCINSAAELLLYLLCDYQYNTIIQYNILY